MSKGALSMKKLGALLVIVMVLGSLMACGKSGNKESSPSSSGASSGGNSEKAVELKLWTFLNPEQQDDPRSVALKSIVDGFNASQGKIKVSVESVHFSKIDSQVIQAVASGGGPDILNVYTDLLRMHVDAKTIQPITKYASEWLNNEGKGDYIYSENQIKLDGEIMALPWEARVFTLFYRKDLYDAAGLKAPQTLSELLAAAKAVKDNNRLGFAVGMSEGANAASFMETFIPILRAAGGKMFDTEGRATFAGDAGVKAINFLKEMVDSGAMNNQTISMTADDITNGLKAGNIATGVSGSMRASAIRGSDTGKNILTTPVPPFEMGQSSPTMVAGQTLTIGVNTKHADEAWEFIRYYLSKESQIKWAEAGVMPVLSSAYEDAAVTGLPNYEELVRWKQEASDSGQIVFYPADYTKLSTELAKAAQKIVFQGAPAKETLESVANAYNANKK
jgi:ABC-type glycerol-3-phosphate transport system substrate-binding protein